MSDGRDMIEKSGKRTCNGWSNFPEEVMKGGLKRIGIKLSLREYPFGGTRGDTFE